MIEELEQRIIELETELGEQYSYIAELEEELFKLNSNNMELQITYDEEIKSLQYELFIEKTKDSEHKFYWFTAKKTPLIVDVSYMGKEKHLYGFKQVPNYSFIEHHDLRFITNCSLDVLFEQFN